MDIYTPQAYADALVKDVENAKHRVILFSHIIGNDASTEKLITSLCDAAKRGVHIEVASDIFTYGIMGSWRTMLLQPDPRVRALRAMAKQFKDSGVKFDWIG